MSIRWLSSFFLKPLTTRYFSRCFRMAWFLLYEALIPLCARETCPPSAEAFKYLCSQCKQGKVVGLLWTTNVCARASLATRFYGWMNAIKGASVLSLPSGSAGRNESPFSSELLLFYKLFVRVKFFSKVISFNSWDGLELESWHLSEDSEFGSSCSCQRPSTNI